MGIFKKFITSLLISILFFGPLLQVSANDSNQNIAVKEILLTKYNLQKIKNGEKYIQAMDKVSEKLKDNPQKLETTSNKINKILNTLEAKTKLSSKEQLLVTVLSYLNAKIAFIQIDNAQQILDEQENSLNEILDAVKNPDISDSDKEELESAIISIQQNLLETSQQNINNIIGEFDSLLNYENTGDFEMNLNLDHESIGVIDAELKLSDYVTQNSNFDSRFQSHISAMIDAAPKGQEAVKLDMSSFIDFILKDGNYYTLVKDLDIVTEENLDYAQDFIDTLKELAEENKYIEFSDEDNKEAIEMVKSLHPDNFFSDAKVLFAQPMFTAYKKEGDTYSIIPTKYACDSLKVLANKFDPFNPSSCTGTQYDNFIEEMLEFGELTMTLGKENILAFSAYPQEDIDEFNGSIAFTDDSITKINLNIIPNQEDYTDELFTISYEKNDHLDIILNIEEGETNIVFESLLDNKNNFSYINHTASIEDYSETFTSSLQLANRKFDGNVKVISNRGNYNYETGEYEITDGDGFFLNLTGKLDNKNVLDEISLDFNVQERGENTLNGTFECTLPNVSFTLNQDNNYSRFNMNFDGEWNTNNKNLDKFDTTIEAFEKERTYNDETYSYENTGKENKIFDMNYSLQNEKLNGVMNVWDESGDTLFLLESKGTYEKNKMVLENSITLSSELSFISQIEKARDSSRISDIMALRNAIEQSYQDNAEYPTIENFNEKVSPYLWSTPIDPKGNVEIDNCKFGYYYEVGADAYGIENQQYKLSTCLESKSNAYKSENDNGNDDSKFEIGVNVKTTKADGFYINGITSWEKVSSQTEYEQPKINVNFGYDYTNSNANSNVFIDAVFEGKKVLKFMMKNTGTIKYKEVEIEAPNNTTTFQDVIGSDMY